MKHLVILFFFTHMGWSQNTDYIRISQKLIESLKSKETNTKEYLDIIANANEGELIKQLRTDDLKKTFFINVYNGFTNYSLKKIQHNTKTEENFLNPSSLLLPGIK